MGNANIDKAIRARMHSTPGSTNPVPMAANARGMIDDTVNKVQGMANDALTSITEGINMAANPMSVLGADLGALTAQATKSISGIMNQVNQGIGGLTSNITSAMKGPQEVADKIASLAADSAEALASPVSFVTKAINDVVEGVNQLPELVGKGKDWLSGMSNDVLGNIGKATGLDIKNTGDLKNAIKSVTSELSKGLDSVKKIKDDVMNTVGGVMQGVNDITNSLAQGVAGTYNAIAGQGGLVDNVIGSLGGIVGEVANGLPPKYAEWLHNKSDRFLGKLEDKAKDAINGSIANVIGKVTGIGMSNDAITELMGSIYQHGVSANGLTTSDGTTMYPTLGNNRQATINKLYAAANAICNNVKLPEYIDYDTNKDLYDALLALAAQYGLAGLIQQLKECIARNGMYFDARSIRVLLDAMGDVCKQGNPFLFESILGMVTQKHMPKIVDKLKHLGANLPDELGIAGAYENLVEKAGYKVTDLLSTGVVPNPYHPAMVVAEDQEDTHTLDPNTVFCGNDVVVMCASSTNVVDAAITMENRSLIQAAMYKYA